MTTTLVTAGSRVPQAVIFTCAGVSLPPRVTLEADDLVTPSQAARLLGVPPATVRSWIRRYGIEPLGPLGRWPAYDFNDIAAVQARMRRARAA